MFINLKQCNRLKKSKKSAFPLSFEQLEQMIMMSFQPINYSVGTTIDLSGPNVAEDDRQHNDEQSLTNEFPPSLDSSLAVSGNTEQLSTTSTVSDDGTVSGHFVRIDHVVDDTAADIQGQGSGMVEFTIHSDTAFTYKVSYNFALTLRNGYSDAAYIRITSLPDDGTNNFAFSKGFEYPTSADGNSTPPPTTGTVSSALLPSGDYEIFINSDTYGGNVDDVATFDWSLIPEAAQITVTSLDKTPRPSDSPGINFSYVVTGTPKQDATINFYWASGINYSDILPNLSPAYTFQLNTPNNQSAGVHGPIYISRSKFSGINDTDIIDKATYLLAEVDGPDGSHTVVPLKLFVPITLDQVQDIIPPIPSYINPPKPFTQTDPYPNIPLKRLTTSQRLQEKAYQKAKAKYNRAEKAVIKYEHSNQYATYQTYSQALVDLLNSPESINTFQITTARRKATFIGQIAEETINLTAVSELPNPEDDTSTSKYHGRGLLMLTDSVKEKRAAIRHKMPASFPANYKAFGNYIETTDSRPGFTNTLVADPNLLVTDSVLGARSGGWYWYHNNVNELADMLSDGQDVSTIIQISRAVNGSPTANSIPNGEPDREDDTKTAFNVLNDFW